MKRARSIIWLLKRLSINGRRKQIQVREISRISDAALEIAAALVEGKLNTSSRESEIPLGNVPVCVFTRPIWHPLLRRIRTRWSDTHRPECLSGTREASHDSATRNFRVSGEGRALSERHRRRRGSSVSFFDVQPRRRFAFDKQEKPSRSNRPRHAFRFESSLSPLLLALFDSPENF